MRHCCSFNPDDVYYLKDNDFYNSRRLSVGFCPICSKPIAELVEYRFDGKINHISVSGADADALVHRYGGDILYSMKECNYRKFKSKPFGWRYGINKGGKYRRKDGIEKEWCRQYASDFYGNKELVKSF